MQKNTPAHHLGRTNERVVTYGVVSGDVLDYRDEHGKPLSMAARLLYAYLDRRQGNNGTAWPSQQTLADEMGVSRSTVVRAYAELEQAGFATHRRRFNQSNVTRITNAARESWQARKAAECVTRDTDKWRTSDTLKRTKNQEPTTTAANEVRTPAPPAASAADVVEMLSELPNDIRQKIRLQKTLIAALSALQADDWTPTDVAALAAETNYAAAENPAGCLVSVLTAAADTATERPSAATKKTREQSDAERLAEQERLHQLLHNPNAVPLEHASAEAREEIAALKHKLGRQQVAA
jgi:DNA-binding transcriptional regulator YhcF (GntR family)